MIKNIKLRPLAISLLVFMILYLGFNALIHFAGPLHAPESNMYLVVVLAGCIPWLVAGYVAASLAKNYGLLHGVLLGSLTSIIQLVDCTLRLPQQLHACTAGTWLYYLAYGIILGGLGSFIWYLKKAIVKKYAK